MNNRKAIFTTPYGHYYNHLLGKVSAEDERLLRQAEALAWTEIFPEKGSTSEVQRALKAIMMEKYHREEARCGCI